MKKLTILFAALTLSAGLWAENTIITYEALKKLYPADLNELKENYVNGDGSKWAQFVEEYPEFAQYNDDDDEESGPLNSIIPMLYGFFNPKCFLDANGQVLSIVKDGLTHDAINHIGTITFDGELVTILGDDSEQLYAFKDCNHLFSITLPEGLTTIGTKAFYNCGGINAITIPASVTTIAESAFANCTALDNISVQWTEATSIPTPGDNAFANIASPATLHVPAKTRALYINTVWGQFDAIDDPGYFTYIDENGEEQAASADLITDAHEMVIWGEHDQTTWYAVPANANVDLFKGAICYGDVRLILADGAILNAGGYDIDYDDTPGIQVSAVDLFSASLTIYAQSTDPNKMGRLFATGKDNAAGIGGKQYENGSNITINGGIVTANGGDNAAGIGGGKNASGSNITINGGIVAANGGGSISGVGGAAGIGGGSNGDGFGITINGGIVMANGGISAAGIGGGYAGNVSGYAGRGYNITINGGTVTAIGGNSDHFFGAGIGNGINAYWEASNIYISDAYVLYAGANENNLQLITHSSATDLASTLTQHYVKIEGLATPYTRSVTDGQWGTVCLPYAVTDFSGVTFYKVNYYNAGEEALYLEEVTALEAGKPYIFEATADGTLTINHEATAPMAYSEVGNEGGLYGSFARTDIESDGEMAAISGGKIVVVNNEGTVTVPACRAYLDMNEVATSQQGNAPLRKFGAPRGTATGEMRIENGEMRMNGKFIINGQFVIVKDGKKINALGF